MITLQYITFDKFMIYFINIIKNNNNNNNNNYNNDNNSNNNHRAFVHSLRDKYPSPFLFLSCIGLGALVKFNCIYYCSI